MLGFALWRDGSPPWGTRTLVLYDSLWLLNGASTYGRRGHKCFKAGVRFWRDFILNNKARTVESLRIEYRLHQNDVVWIH